MNQSSPGCNLAFIGCQPRSGSTLLQRMLGTHPAIYTTSEPWLMLPPAYMLRETGVEAEYDANLARRAIREFWDDLPNGRADYIEGLRHMYGFLYQRALADTEGQIFLDKTPRYYLILSELREIFPEARFILLIRNPLAVLSSILRTWVGDRWLKLSNFRLDLLEAPKLILNAQRDLEESAVIVHYEDVVQQPKAELSTLCDHLGVEFDPAIIEYGRESIDPWKYGDPESVYEHQQPKKSSLEKWVQPENAQQWKLLYDYIRELGENTMNGLGYDYGRCIRTLENARPSQSELRYTYSIEWLLSRPVKNQGYWERHAVELTNALQDGGVVGAVHHVMKQFCSGLKRKMK